MLFLCIGFIISIGVIFLFIIYGKDIFNNLLEKFGLSWGLGIGILVYQMFFISLVGIRWTKYNLIFPWVVVIIIFLIYSLFSKKKIKFGDIFKNSEIGSWLNCAEIALILLILFISTYVFVLASLVPTNIWDAWVIYGGKTQVLYFDNILTSGNMMETCFPEYPPGIPLAQAFICKILNEWNIAAYKVIFFFFFISFLVIFYKNLRKYLTRIESLLFTFLLSSIPLFANMFTSGLIDSIVGYYYCIGFFYLFLWFMSSKNENLIISAVFSGMASFIKNEGLIWFLSNVLILLIYLVFSKKLLKNIKYLLMYLAIGLAFVLPWQYFARVKMGILSFQGGTFSLTSLSVIPQNLGRLKTIISYFIKNVFLDIKNFNILWIFYFIIVALKFKKMIFSKHVYIFLNTVMNLALLVMIFIVTPQVLQWHLQVAGRLVLQFVPIVLFQTGLLFSNKKLNNIIV